MLKDFCKLNVKIFFFSGSDYGILRTTLRRIVCIILFSSLAAFCYSENFPAMMCHRRGEKAFKEFSFSYAMSPNAHTLEKIKKNDKISSARQLAKRENGNNLVL